MSQRRRQDLKDHTFWISYPYFEIHSSITLLALPNADPGPGWVLAGSRPELCGLGSLPRTGLGLGAVLQDRLPFRWGFYGQLFKGLLVFLVVSLGWLLFKLPDFREVIQFLRVFRYNILLKPDSSILINIIFYSSPVIFYHLAYIYKNKLSFINQIAFQTLMYALMLFLIVFNAGSTQSFIYFQF